MSQINRDIQDVYEYIEQHLQCSDREKAEIQQRLILLAKNAILVHLAETKDITHQMLSSLKYSNVFPL